MVGYAFQGKAIALYEEVGEAMATKKSGLKKDRLIHFRKKLLEKQRQLLEEVGKNSLYVKGQEDDSIKDIGDQASTAYTREFLFGLGNGDRRLLKEVNRALERIEEGSFGVCERCGDLIAEKRLEVIPFARYCIHCQRLAEEEEREAVG